MPYPYEPPAFLEGQTVDEIHARMLDALPDNMDKSELQIPWDFTRPAAIEKAEFVQFELNETIKIIFPHWAYGKWLDKHAEMVGLQRRDANKASGYLYVTGKAGITVAQGFQFATAANLTPSIAYEALDDTVFDGTPDDSGQVSMMIQAQALVGGLAGNVPHDTVILMVNPDVRISYVTNLDAMTGGTEIESDDDLRERVLAAIRGGISFVGNDADYVRWGKEVNAVGSVVVDPEWNDPNMPAEFHFIGNDGKIHCAGAVRLFIVDANGMPANLQILNAVYDHIVSPNDRLMRLAPIGATVTVVAPAPVMIDIAAHVTLHPQEDINVVTERFKANLQKYWLTAAQEKTVKYVYIGSTLAETAGMANYEHTTFFVNSATFDIAIELGQFPVTGTVTLNG